MGVIFRPRHVLNGTNGDDGTFHVTGTTLDELCSVILEDSLMLIKVDGITDDGANGRRRDDIRLEPILLHGLLLFQSRTVSHIHGLS